MMIRLCCLIAISLVALTSVYSQTDDLKQEGLHGPVRSVRSQWIDSIPTEGGRSQQRPGQSTVLNFDRSGQLVESIVYDDSNRLFGTEKFTHDAEGKLLTVETTNEMGRPDGKFVYKYEGQKLKETQDYDSKGVLVLKQTYVYGPDGKVLEDNYYEGPTLMGKTVYKHDAKGQILEAAFFLADGSRAVAPLGPCYSAHRIANKYNDAGQTIETISYQPSGEVKQASSFRYDDKGNLKAEFRKDVYSTLDYLHEYEFDAHGNWVKETILNHATRAAAPMLGIESSESDHQTIRIRQITYY